MDKWKEIESRLQGVYSSIKLDADGYELYLIRQLSKDKLVTAVYVNGYINGEWHKADKDGNPLHPEARFWHPYRSRPYKLKAYPALKRVYGKKEADCMTALRTVAYLPSWSSLRSLMRHLKKNFPDLTIKVVEGVS